MGTDSHPEARRIKSFVVRVESDDPLMARWRYTCCGYEHGEPLCLSGYVPVDKGHCPRCGERTARYGRDPK